MEALEALFRWMHVFAGIIWIGHLYFFNWVNGPFQTKIDGPTKKLVNPELMPRALYWFRWGAAYTWITGFLLLGIVYYMGGAMVEDQSQKGLASGVGVASLLVGWAIYDVLWKAMAKSEMAGIGVSFVLVVATAFGLSMVIETLVVNKRAADTGHPILPQQSGRDRRTVRMR